MIAPSAVDPPGQPPHIQMEGVASGEGRVYQAAGDQTINHHHHYPPHPPGAAGEAQRLGHPLAQVDPIALEVHLAIDAGAAAAGLGALPAYVPRTHDEKLATVVGEAQRGRSRIVVLVGGSSTGKTRALWEAVSGLEEPWHLWHPIDPGQPQAALAGLRRVAPHTVIWLNEMQHYLLTGDDIGEQVAAGLRELLHSPKQGPVLVMGTLWPEYAAILSAIPAPGRPDPHAQARKLFNGADMRVPVRSRSPALRWMWPSAWQVRAGILGGPKPCGRPAPER